MRSRNTPAGLGEKQKVSPASEQQDKWLYQTVLTIRLSLLMENQEYDSPKCYRPLLSYNEVPAVEYSGTGA